VHWVKWSPLSDGVREEVEDRKVERTEEGGKGKEPFREEFRTEWRHAIVPQALPQESCCWIKKSLGSSMSVLFFLNTSRLAGPILSEGKSRHIATHFPGNIARRSGSKPQTSQNEKVSGQPREWMKGLRIEGLDSSGSHWGAGSDI